MNQIKRTITVFVLLLGISVQHTVSAQTSMVQVEALYIYNFIKNVRWSNVNDKYVVGVYADGATFDGIKAVLSERKFNNKTIEVKQLSKVEEAFECHIVFVNESNGPMVKKIVAVTETKNMLIVSERGQLENGASIAFVLNESKLQFKINQDAFKTSGLQISASLLALGV